MHRKSKSTSAGNNGRHTPEPFTLAVQDLVEVAACSHRENHATVVGILGIRAVANHDLAGKELCRDVEYPADCVGDLKRDARGRRRNFRVQVVERHWIT